MKYIKDYYNKNDYKEIIFYFFKLFVTENLLNISESDYYFIFNNSINNIINDIENKKIKSDKNYFFQLEMNYYF